MMSKGTQVNRNSHKQGLITKKCVTMHTNYFLNLKMALYSSALVIKLFNNSKKLFLIRSYYSKSSVI